MRIAVCDDEPVQAKYLSSLVRRWAAGKGADCSVRTYGSAEQLLYAWNGETGFDVLLLDIQMPGESGMELAREIRRCGDPAEIIFITGYSDYIEEGYEVSALHYLMKPVRAEKLFECLDRACERRGKIRRTVLVRCGEETVRLYQDEILYLEAFSHSVKIVASSGSRESEEGIGDLEKKLEAGRFFRPHRSYLVNLGHVREIGKTALTLDEGVELPVSRRRCRGLNEAFLRFYRGAAL